MKLNLRKLFAALAILMLLMALAFTATAQVTPLATARIYPLTNATTFKLSTGSTNMATAALTLINSAPFPLKPGRGFAYQLSFVGTNANANAVTPFWQVATPYYSNSVLVTNWSTYIPGQGCIANGTTVVNFYTNQPPITVDNAVLCRLAVVSNAHNASTLLDPTNTFAFITAP